MNYYIYIYAISVIVGFYSGNIAWKLQKNISGFFFLIFTIFLSIWLTLYIIFFADIFSEFYLLYISRFAFALSNLGMYSLLYFIIFFGEQNRKIFIRPVWYILIAFFGLLCIYIFTDFIISGLTYDSREGVFREIYGSGISLHMGLNLLFIPLCIYFSIRTIKKQDPLNKIRLKNILFSAFLLLFSLIILQLVLPYFGIWILEKEIIFLFTAFVIFVPFTLHRYYFTHIGYSLGKLFIVVLSLITAISINFSIEYILEAFSQNQSGISYWFGKNAHPFVPVAFILCVYYSVHYLLKRFFSGNDKGLVLHKQLQKTKKKISIIQNFDQLNGYIQKQMHTIFAARSSQLYLYHDSDLYSHIRDFFQQQKPQKIFINDIVFLHKNNYKFSDNTTIKLSQKDIFLAYPIYDKSGENIGLFMLGTKIFGDFYSIDEIALLEEFSFFLENHLKYIDTYSSLQDLSLNLDKKVDDKTIEYNDLINRQKEFIALISHEIKSPLSSAIFQSDSILHDLDTIEPNADKMREELTVLNTQLVRTGGLISKLFSVQYYDNHNVNLFLEEIGFTQFLEYEIELFSRMYEDITFISQIDKDIGFIKIDKIQFQQVINNLLDNAVKFTENTDPIIAIKAQNITGGIEMIIEDNGKGFADLIIENIFDKYTTGSNKNVGLGMGLYLCEKIVSMHAGTIKASYSEIYGGARFTIFLPKL